MRPGKDFFSFCFTVRVNAYAVVRVATLTLAGAALLACPGCGLFTSAPEADVSGGEPTRPTAAHVQPLADETQASPASTTTTAALRPIRIASFNIQVFGKTKMGIPHVVDVLSDVMRQFDIVAIQEIRSLDQNVMPNFIAEVNKQGAKYDFVIGPRLGRSHSKEQYAYVFNTETVRLFWPSVYTLEDKDDVLHREPLIASFQTIVNQTGKPFRFTLMNVHVDPDEAKYELSKLDDAFLATQAAVGGEDDVILAGDLNADPRNYQDLGRLANVAWAVVGIPTNTRGTRGYDNLLFDRVATVEYMGRSGVMDLQSRYQLTREQALEVSDHLPVWAEFYPYEVEPNLDLAAPPQIDRR